MYRLVNVPTETSELEINGIVDGETIRIVCQAKGSAPSDYIIMTDTYVGDHMFAKPADLRRMYANDLASAIRMARDAGYAQAQAEIRAALGITRLP